MIHVDMNSQVCVLSTNNGSFYKECVGQVALSICLPVSKFLPFRADISTEWA